LGFELAGLGGDEAQHHELTLGYKPKRLEAAGELAVVVHEIAVDVGAVEQHLGLGVVGARAHEGRFVVAAAQMHRDRHVGGNVRHSRIDQVGVKGPKLFRVVAALDHLVAVLRIAQHGDEHFVELQIAAAGGGKAAHRLLVGIAEIEPELVHVRISLLVDRSPAWPSVDRRRRGDGDLRRAFGVRGDELEMLDHRVRPGHAELARDLDAFVARIDAGEGDAGFHDMLLGAVEAPEKIEMPPRAAEFAVSDGVQADVLLLPDDALDLAVFDFLERLRRHLALGAPGPRLVDRFRPQQAADVVGAEWWLQAFHPHTSSAISTIMRSLAHCSSSASTLPSSLDAKPHCGDRQSWSMGTNFAASSMRRLISSLDSSVPVFEVTRPSTTCLPLGTKRKGSKPPARSLSYSMK